MASNGSGSFFSVPETPPQKMGEKAEWELPQVTLFTPKHSLYTPPCKMNEQELKIYSDLMADTSTESDTDNQPAGKMSPGTAYESDSSVEILKTDDIQKFEKKMIEKKMIEKNMTEKKRLKKEFLRAEQNKKLRMFVPTLFDSRLIFVRDHFVGVQNYHTVRAVDKDGVIYKRAILKDGSVAHNFVVSTDQLLFKMDGEMVYHKTPGARGIVNITRLQRVPFHKLVEQTFENEQA